MSTGVQEDRSTGVQEYRSTGVQEYRHTGVPGYTVQEYRKIIVDKVFEKLYVHYLSQE